jgi:tRNA (uracil-5-)-methyltransferase TRM9
MNEQTAKKLIDKTRDDYNLIAKQFSSTRHYVWGDFAEATTSISFSNKTVLDLGCGNGRLFEFLSDKNISSYYGIDQSDKLIQVCLDRYKKGHFSVGNLLKTPYENEQFDIVLCLATLHHIPTAKLRNQALSEIFRVLRPGGTLLMTNWYFWNKTKFLQQIFSYNKLPLGDFLMPWKTGDGKKVTDRYFHAWTKRETRQLLENSGFINIDLSGFKHNVWYKIGPNLIAIAQKPK